MANGLLAVDAEEITAEDDADIQEIIRILKSVGYEGIEDYDYEALEKLLQREHSFLTTTTKSREVLPGIVQEIVDWVSISDATYFAGESEDDLDFLRKNFAYSVDDKVYSAIDSLVYKNVKNDRAVDADEVYENIVNSGLVDANDPDVLASLQNYIQQVIPTLMQRERNRDLRMENKAKARYRVAKCLLRKELQAMKRLKHTPEDKIKLSRCFRAVGEKLETVCPVCGKTISVFDLPIRILSVPSSKVSKLEAFSVFMPIFCEECGSAVVLTMEEYNKLSEGAIENYKVSTGKRGNTLVNQAIKQESTLCNGATSLNITPPIEVFSEILPELVVHEEITVDEADTVEDLTSESQEDVKFTVSDIEYEEAVKVFYDKLKMFGCGTEGCNDVDSKGSQIDNGAEGEQHSVSTRENNKFSSESPKIRPKQVAAYMLQQLSLDYVTEKNKAIYSLVYYFQDNPILSNMLSLTRIWSLKDDLQLVAGLTDQTIEYVSQEKKAILLELRRLLSTEYGLQWDYNKSEREQLHELLESLPLVGKLLERYQNERKEAIRFIQANEDAFGYCKLINSSTMKLSTLEDFLDNEFADSIDRITDLMLINGYAENFFDVWKTFGILPYKTVVDACMVSTSTVHSYNSIVAKMEKVLEKFGVQFGFSRNYFGVFVLPVDEEHKTLRDAYSALQSRNFYRFCKIVRTIPNDIKSRVSYGLSVSLREAIDKIREVDDTAEKSEAEYYLRDFSSEELANANTDLGLLTFSGWIPRRLGEETIDDYVKRYKEFQQAENPDLGNAWCSADLFNSVKAEALVIATAAIFSSAEYRNFSTATFISRAIGSLLTAGSDEVLQYFLNLTDELYNLIEATTPYFDFKAMGLEHNETYYRVTGGYYISTVSKFIKSLLLEYDQYVLHAEVSLEQGLRDFGKLDKLHHLFGILRGSEDSSEELSDPETMLNEVAEKCSGDLLVCEDLEGFN